MSTYFAADVHLDPAQPSVWAAWENFLDTIVAHAHALYILGDLFEMWIGDDDDDPFARRCQEQLARFSARVPLYLLHGNRDFLISGQFTAATGVRLLEEHAVVTIYDRPTLVLHGDTLCTADSGYQAVRRQLRSSEWQSSVLAQSVSDRRTMGTAMREQSRRTGANLAAAIADADEPAAEALARQYGVTRMIHGHTHRPAVHRRQFGDGFGFTRYVLGAWSPAGVVLRVTPSGSTALVPLEASTTQSGRPE